MSLHIGDTAPDFEARSTEGTLRFHEWLGDDWGVLFSHPKDFTPVCTTELGYLASIKPEFDRRRVKIIGLSVDPTGDHDRWARDIEDTQGHAPNYPIIGDADFAVSKLYGMLPADTSGEAGARTPADNQTLSAAEAPTCATSWRALGWLGTRRNTSRRVPRPDHPRIRAISWRGCRAPAPASATTSVRPTPRTTPTCVR